MNRIVNIKVHLTVIYGCDTMSKNIRGEVTCVEWREKMKDEGWGMKDEK